MKDKLLIIGASGHGKVVAEIALKMKRWQEISFLDDDESIILPMGLDVIGNTVTAKDYIDEYDIFVAIGNNAIRQKLIVMLESMGASIPVLIHPSAVVGDQVVFGNGTAIMAGAIVNCCTRIGKGCVVNTGATVDHDNSIEDFVHISPGVHVAGTVKIGKGSWLGIGSVVSNNVTIPCDCKIGAGAVVVKDIYEPGLYVGVPARRV